MKIKKYKLRIPLLLTIVAWFFYGQLMAYGISSGYISDIGYLVWDNFGQYIPSIMRLTKTGSEPHKFLASVMLASMPLLFTALLFADVEEHIKGVRIKKSEVIAVTIACIAGSSIFIAGFGHRAFRGSYFAFSTGAAFLTYISAYAYRVSYCLMFQTPKQEAAERLH